MPPLLHSHHHRRRLLSEGAPVEQSFLLQRVQPALSGLMDGSLSTLAPIFAVVLATHTPLTAFFTGLATALGAGREHGVLRRPVRHR
jgi:Na+-translocating ferredoxin:NAD+ oxidoreductase RnfD subunit